MIPWQGPPHSHLPWAAGQAWKMRDGPVCAAGPRGEGGAEAGASAHAQGSGASFALASQRPGEVPLPSPPPLQATEGPSCAEGVPGQSLRKEACGPARWDWPSPNPGSFPPLKHNVFIRSCRARQQHDVTRSPSSRLMSEESTCFRCLGRELRPLSHGNGQAPRSPQDPPRPGGPGNKLAAAAGAGGLMTIADSAGTAGLGAQTGQAPSSRPSSLLTSRSSARWRHVEGGSPVPRPPGAPGCDARQVTVPWIPRQTERPVHQAAASTARDRTCVRSRRGGREPGIQQDQRPKSFQGGEA
ncbi:translation initiation factor IF-2-like [Felis catus]|uniref:translation initiation factor IF-2-like n=1 Tax=Felis catus TaxID=9685 RepID=UPI001D19EDF0|nr:translation initiation factor IF-2-like [Felis catus]